MSVKDGSSGDSSEVRVLTGKQEGGQAQAVLLLNLFIARQLREGASYLVRPRLCVSPSCNLYHGIPTDSL